MYTSSPIFTSDGGISNAIALAAPLGCSISTEITRRRQRCAEVGKMFKINALNIAREYDNIILYTQRDYVNAYTSDRVDVWPRTVGGMRRGRPLAATRLVNKQRKRAAHAPRPRHRLRAMDTGE
ncbi:hypothetical protein EVAR_43070_1 [Eumeta japonica]|uniref:Uncharacterized protein n=1 Tax=Eumeta variegata TaxID=151549 RepID=A0A4C1WUV3_EUMVA|nr:hypothetical protein EVAR_43070_1 [Eumeta japonica]